MRQKSRSRVYVLTAVSLLLCAATVVLWVRSYSRCDYADRVTPSRYFITLTFPGGAKFLTFAHTGQSPEVSVVSYPYNEPGVGTRVTPADASWSKLGFDFRKLVFNGAPAPGPAAFELFIPFWFLAGTFGLAPAAFAAGRVRRWRRAKKGLCSRCAYPLTGNVSGVCPECGTKIP